jgi:hypothetical protein
LGVTLPSAECAVVSVRRACLRVIAASEGTRHFTTGAVLGVGVGVVLGGAVVIGGVLLMGGGVLCTVRSEVAMTAPVPGWFTGGQSPPRIGCWATHTGSGCQES